ncbi:hypothetical protein DUNSADRAFT_16023, partial [Dunaliella salina]
VVENWSLKTCIRDDRKCLQACDFHFSLTTNYEMLIAGFGVWGSQEACCAHGAAFNEGCGKVEASPEPCWIVDTYFPSRLCRRSNTLCDKPEAGVQAFRTEEECCAPGRAFSELPDVSGFSLSVKGQSQHEMLKYCTQTFSTVQNLEDPRTQSVMLQGCSSPPPVPCWVKDEDWPYRTCSKSDDIALCHRGWGVYVSKDICCSPNVAFQ